MGYAKISNIKKTKLYTKIPVYDIEVNNDNHNFILSNGMVIHNCVPYEYLKKTIYEQRILLPRFGINLLTEELVGLEKNNNSGKIDHTPSGINSKDSADAVCGALYNASLHADEFALDYGESLDILTEFNQEFDLGDYNEQFVNNLKSVFSKPDLFEDEDRGKSVSEFYDVLDGVLAW